MNIKKRFFSLEDGYRLLLLGLIVFSAAVFGTIYLLKVNEVSGFYQNTLADIMKEAEEVSKKSYIEAKKKEPVYINLPNSEAIKSIRENYNEPSSLWVVVNKSRTISKDYIPSELVVPSISNPSGLFVRKEASEPLENMIIEAKKSGLLIKIISAYRSYEYQENLFETSVASVGRETANQSIAIAGQSEHQTGLALDLGSYSGTCLIENCFKDTQEGKWLAENAHSYGFILRYPSGKESITGYTYEPWHFRYVGTELATALYRSGLTLDEALPYLEKALNTLISNGAIPIKTCDSACVY